MHITLRVQAGLPSLRVGRLLERVQKALAGGQDRFGFRLVHFTVQSNHLHLIAEAADRRSLARGMQGLNVRVARAINGQLGRKGRVFSDRYHARALRTPRAVHFALRYVLLNARKHQRSTRSSLEASESELPTGLVDFMLLGAVVRRLSPPDGASVRRRSGSCPMAGSFRAGGAGRCREDLVVALWKLPLWIRRR